MTFTDALGSSTGARPITRITPEGYRMVGYNDGSVDVLNGKRRIKQLPAGTGPALGYTDWQVMPMAIAR